MALEWIYVLCGLAMAGFYVPQILTCANDQSGLAAYSLSKAVTQLTCRALMLPFVWVTVDSATMLTIQSIDAALRAVEVACALGSLRRQGISWRVAMRGGREIKRKQADATQRRPAWRLKASPMNAIWRKGHQRLQFAAHALAASPKKPRTAQARKRERRASRG